MMDSSSEWTNPPDFEKRLLMRTYEPRDYSINDLLEWDRTGQLELNPLFQRREVWTDKAKSYLLDTILRGKPIPKLFIRQRINVLKKTTIRDVVDGQQRIRTILAFVKDGFTVSKLHNQEYGDLRFSQLPSEIQAQVLEYTLSVDLLVSMTNAEVLDIFSRLNSYAVVLNEQERINSNHFSSFKLLADKIGHKYNTYWTKQKILTDKNIMRMLEVNLVADVLIAMMEGIKTKKRVAKYYDSYEVKFTGNVEELENRFDTVIAKIGEIYSDGLADTEFSRPFLFYSLFTAVTHRLYGLKGIADLGRRKPLSGPVILRARYGLDRVNELFAVGVENIGRLTKNEQQFLQDSRRATTDESVRLRRTRFLLELMA
jgi:hypothetical protein